MEIYLRISIWNIFKWYPSKFMVIAYGMFPKIYFKFLSYIYIFIYIYIYIYIICVYYSFCCFEKYINAKLNIKYGKDN